MKIALVLPGGVDRSGEVRVIPVFLALVERLARAHEVHVFALHQESKPGQWPLLGATVHNIGDGWTRLRALAAIRDEHRRGPFDVIQALFSGACGQVAVVAARWLHARGVVHIGGGELVSMPRIGYGGRRNWKGRLREACVLRGAHAVTAASMPVVQSLLELGIHARRIALGVDLRAWPPLAPRRRGASVARLIHVASLNRVKDQPTLLHALAKLKRAGIAFQMDIVGVDTLDGQVQALASHLGLDANVQFLGFRTHRELRDLVKAADLLVMSSAHEAGPMVLFEAAIAGVPAVGTAVGHLVEWSPSAALAVPVGDATALASGIERLLANEDLRLHMAGIAQHRAIVEDADYTARAFETLYLEVLGPLPAATG